MFLKLLLQSTENRIYFFHTNSPYIITVLNAKVAHLQKTFTLLPIATLYTKLVKLLSKGKIYLQNGDFDLQIRAKTKLT